MILDTPKYLSIPKLRRYHAIIKDENFRVGLEMRSWFKISAHQNLNSMRAWADKVEDIQWREIA